MNILQEMNQKANELGKTNFSKSSMADPFIKKIITHISNETNVPVKDIEAKIDEKLKEFADLMTKAPILYHTISLNIIENEVFNALKDVNVKGAPTFSVITFTKLIRLIKQEHTSLFPMKNFYDHEVIHDPRVILIPSSDDKVMKRFGKVDTACATPKGEFCFNVKFMQELLNFAHLKQLKPKSKKYTNNSGDIPPEYAYIEFVIMHEFMHYTYADFHYSKVYKADPTIANWVGDFRTNYDLVKNNHEQLPIGLYNDLVNLDRQKNWKEMYDIVKSEFDKLNKNQQKQVSGALGDAMNGEHGDPSEGEGEGEEKPGEGEGDKPGEGKGDKPGEGEGKGDNPTSSKEDAEKGEKSARARGSKDKEVGKEAEDKKGGDKAGKGQGSAPGRRGAGQDGSNAIDYTKFSPTMSWKALLAKLVRSSTEEETSYQKVHRRNITRVHTAAQTGKSAMKPGDVEIESTLLKLAIVVDSSGSMSSKIEQVYSNLAYLIKAHSSDIKLGFVLVKFSNDHKMYKCVIDGQGSYVELKSPTDDGKTLQKGSLKQLFSEHFGSSTNFNSSLTSDLDVFIKDDYNVLVISDTDIIAGENLTEFNDFFKRSHGKVYLIAADKDDYHLIIAAMKNKSANITHM